MARQTMELCGMPSHYASADEPALKSEAWIGQQWEVARGLVKKATVPRCGALLVLDAVQKLPGWSECVKRLWDEDTHADLPLHVILLGSAPLLMARGLTESLAGRFETVPMTHWLFPEMREAFGWDLDTYIFYGGYPGAAVLISDPERWTRYVQDSLIETTVSRDILLLQRIDKPALLRRLFELACSGSGQIVSYTKMLGQLHDAGNTVTLAHYLDLLDQSGLVAGLHKYAGGRVRQRASSPKLQVLNTALMSALSAKRLDQVRGEAPLWGRWVESAVGAHLHAVTRGTDMSLHYWAEGDLEVDFVVTRGDTVVGIEVKSGAQARPARGMEAFRRKHPSCRCLLVGTGGIPLEEFLCAPPSRWVS